MGSSSVKKKIIKIGLLGDDINILKAFANSFINKTNKKVDSNLTTQKSSISTNSKLYTENDFNKIEFYLHNSLSDISLKKTIEYNFVLLLFDLHNRTKFENNVSWVKALKEEYNLFNIIYLYGVKSNDKNICATKEEIDDFIEKRKLLLTIKYSVYYINSLDNQEKIHPLEELINESKDYIDQNCYTGGTCSYRK